MLNRALELLDSARLLLPQNTDPQISDSTISGEVANIQLSLGRDEQGVQLLKQNNAGDIYSDLTGMTLATDSSRYAEAMPFLTAALCILGAGLAFRAADKNIDPKEEHSHE